MKFMTWIFLVIGVISTQSALAFPVLSSVDVLSINQSTLEKINDKDTLVIVGTLEGNLCDNSLDSLLLFPTVEGINKKGEVRIKASLQSSARSELSFVSTICLTFSRTTPFKIGLDVSRAFQDLKAKTLKLTIKKSYEENLVYELKTTTSGLSLTKKPNEEPEDELLAGLPRITIKKSISAPYAVSSISDPRIEEELIRPSDSFAGNEVLFYLDVEGPTLRCPESQGFQLEPFFVSDAYFEEFSAKLYYGLNGIDKFTDDDGFETMQLPLVPLTCELDRKTRDTFSLSVRVGDRDDSQSSDEVPATVTRNIKIQTVNSSGNAKVFTYKATRNDVQRWSVTKE